MFSNTAALVLVPRQSVVPLPFTFLGSMLKMFGSLVEYVSVSTKRYLFVKLVISSYCSTFKMLLMGKLVDVC